ncbi:MAG: 3-phosphoshikimate 1-carboxyvinyltransferase [Hyphomicrobiaceae bacterium]
MSTPITAHKSQALIGKINVPGDKSISHRALIFGGLATGITRVRGLLESEDVVNTARVISAMGAPVEQHDGGWVVRGTGVGGLAQPSLPLDFGNSGTGARLMLGVIAGHDLTATLIGDASLSRRPMGRVLGPLHQMGLRVKGNRETLPIDVTGTAQLIPIEYALPVPSAQVKSAVLIAGLHAPGATSVIEAERTRDHTERMLRYFGASVDVASDNRATRITVAGNAELAGRELTVPGDPSSAAFLAAAAAIVPGSDVSITDVLINPTRIGFFVTLREMGADIRFENEREECGEPIADIRVRASQLSGVTVPAERAPSMIDEYPILAVIAAFADGSTVMHGLAELKVKESDRLAATAIGLNANGVTAQVDGDTLTVIGGTNRVRGGAMVTTHLDHRIAMAFLTLGLASDRPVTVDDGDVIATSFPQFVPLMHEIGAHLEAQVGSER